MIGPALKDGLTLHLSGEIISRPYINLTLQLMQDFGAKAAWTSPSSISVAPQLYQSIPFKVENDWSAASYWYQIAALSPKAEIELLGLFHNSYQGDSRGAEVFSRLGITTDIYIARCETEKNRQSAGKAGRGLCRYSGLGTDVLSLLVPC